MQTMEHEGNVKICPITKMGWEARTAAKRGDCGGQSVYHCLADRQGRKWERCVEKSLVKEGFCPIFTSKGFVDWKSCNLSSPTCPQRSYFSNEVYEYPWCFGDNSEHGNPDGDNEGHEGFSAKLIGGVVGIMVILLVALVGFLIMRRKRLAPTKHPDTEDDQTKTQLISGIDTKDDQTELQQFSDTEAIDIVKENHVISGLNELSKEEVRSVVVVGKFGNMVSSTSRCISKNFKLKQKWKSEEYRYTDIPNTVEENTIVYVYGWFGLWNDDLCSKDKVKSACQSLKRILMERENVKIIIGMRSDLYKKYHQELEEADDDLSVSLFHYEIYLDSADVRKDGEYTSYFKENIQGTCKETNCACKKMTYEMLRKGKDKVIGMPLKINIIKRYHELITNYLDNYDILKAMSDHFSSMERDIKRIHVYEWIMYICFKGRFSRSDPLDTYLVNEMNFQIEMSSFDEKDTELSRYVRMRNSDKLRKVSSVDAQYVFWHPFIFICAFHFLFHKYPKFVMKYCNVDAIFQLVRPRWYKTLYFEVAAEDRYVTLFNQRIRSLGIMEEYAQHPLVKFGIGNAETMISSSI